MTHAKHTFKAAVKKTDGYNVPEGAVISWNDLCDFISHHVTDRKIVGYEKFDGIEQDNTHLEWNDGYQTRLTSFGLALRNFSSVLNTAMVDGRVALFQRFGYSHSYSPENVPSKLNQKNTKGYLLSLTEIKQELQVFIYKHDRNPVILHGAQHLDTLINIAESELIDFSDTDFDPVNSPVPRHKLKNTPEDRLKQKSPESYFNKPAL